MVTGMNLKNGLICLIIIAILTACVPNVAAVPPMSNFTTNTHSNYVGDLKGDRQQTNIDLYLGPHGERVVTIGLGQRALLEGFLSFDTPPTSLYDSSHGIPDTTVNIQSLNPNGSTWSNVATTSTGDDPWIGNGLLSTVGWFKVTLTPAVAGVYTYRVTFDGDNQYAPCVSNTVTLTVTNMAIS